jgi:hypothetical protein
MNLKDTPPNKNLIYDVGLYKEQDTDFYLKKGFQVVAFEANPENIDFWYDTHARLSSVKP